MSGVGILLGHVVARREGKPPFFFSRYNLPQIKERGNTHYCFHCGGHWGFIPDKDGNPTNHMDSRVSLEKEDGEYVSYVLIEEALRDVNLEPHITDSDGYPRRKPEDRGYKEWLGYHADFDYTPEFVQWCEENGYKVFRFNPMEKHDPITHADAVVDGVDEFDFASEWLAAKIPANFPYVVTMT